MLVNDLCYGGVARQPDLVAANRDNLVAANDTPDICRVSRDTGCQFFFKKVKVSNHTRYLTSPLALTRMADETPKMEYRLLGDTGLRVSVLCL